MNLRSGGRATSEHHGLEHHSSAASSGTARHERISAEPRSSAQRPPPPPLPAVYTTTDSIVEALETMEDTPELGTRLTQLYQELHEQSIKNRDRNSVQLAIVKSGTGAGDINGFQYALALGKRHAVEENKK